MAFWPLALVALVSGQTAEIFVLSSEYTNMITQISVGRAEDVLLVSLSFSTSELFFYSTSMCPPFVKCLDTLSTSYKFVSDGSFINTDDAMDLYTASELFHLEGVTLPTRMNFGIGHYLTKSTTDELDVAGRIGLGPGSKFIRNRILQLRVDFPSSGTPKMLPKWQMFVIAPGALKQPFSHLRISVSAIGKLDSWNFKTKVGCSVADYFGEVVASFVPNISDLAVPEKEWESFTEYLSLHNGDIVYYTLNHRLFVECGSGALKLSLMFERGYFSIYNLNWSDNSVLKFTRNNVRFCPTRIVSGDTWQFGLPLLASLESIELDSPHKRIHFNLLRSRKQRRDSVVDVVAQFELHSIPELSMPEIITSDDSSVVLNFSNPSTWSGRPATNLLPVNRNGRIGSSGNIIFTFAKRLIKSGNQPGRKEQLPGIYHLGAVKACTTKECPEGMQIQLIPAYDIQRPSYSVILVDIELSALLVVLQKVEARSTKAHFRIAAPTKWTPESQRAGDDPFCSICRCEYDTDDSIQSLAPACNHTFHVDCISDWLAGHTNCCICRTEIPYQKDKQRLLAIAEAESSS